MNYKRKSNKLDFFNEVLKLILQKIVKIKDKSQTHRKYLHIANLVKVFRIYKEVL